MFDYLFMHQDALFYIKLPVVGRWPGRMVLPWCRGKNGDIIIFPPCIAEIQEEVLF